MFLKVILEVWKKRLKYNAFVIAHTHATPVQQEGELRCSELP